MYKIMMVEDDEVIAGMLARQLEKWGYRVVRTEDFSRVLEQFCEEKPDLVLMDISLPFFNGYYWCGEIRKISQAPIIVITSAGDDMNLVMAVNMGADDFIAKPFHMEVVTAKIQALLRRAYAFDTDKSVLRAAGATLNLYEAVLYYGDKSLKLSGNEFKILELLMRQKGKTVSREEIMRALWENEAFIDDNTLTVNMTRLRRKLADIGLENWIETRKGLGYFIGEKETNA